jgi:hypothetical protein
MRFVLKSRDTKLFSTNQYLTKNQIRRLFRRLAKQRTVQLRNHWMDDNENDETSTSSDEDAAEDYFRIEQDQELEDMKVNEIDNALNCCSDDEYDLDQLK